MNIKCCECGWPAIGSVPLADIDSGVSAGSKFFCALHYPRTAEAAQSETPVLAAIKAAFDGDDVPRKNVELRRAYGEIERLRTALIEIRDRKFGRRWAAAGNEFRGIARRALWNTPEGEKQTIADAVCFGWRK